MKFQYLREPANPSGAHPTRHSTLRPRIPIRLRYGNRYIDLFALIDSGADECLFPIEVARALRIDLKVEKGHQYAGIGAKWTKSSVLKIICQKEHIRPSSRPTVDRLHCAGEYHPVPQEEPTR